MLSEYSVEDFLLKKGYLLKFESADEPVLFDVYVNGKSEGKLFYEVEKCDLYLFNCYIIHPPIILDMHDYRDDYEFQFIIFINNRYIFGYGTVHESGLYENVNKNDNVNSYLYLKTYSKWEKLIKDLPIYVQKLLYSNMVNKVNKDSKVNKIDKVNKINKLNKVNKVNKSKI